MRTCAGAVDDTGRRTKQPQRSRQLYSVVFSGSGEIMMALNWWEPLPATSKINDELTVQWIMSHGMITVK